MVKVLVERNKKKANNLFKKNAQWEIGEAKRHIVAWISLFAQKSICGNTKEFWLKAKKINRLNGLNQR